MNRRAKSRAAFVVACALNAFFQAGATATAATLSWDLAPPTSGDWFQATNWSPDLMPSASDEAFISNQGTAVIGSGAAAISALTLGQTNFGNLTQTGGSLAAANITVNDTSAYQLSGGTLEVTTRFDLLGQLNFAGGNATVNLAANGILDWSRGTMSNAANTTVTGGSGSTIYLPAS